MNNTRTTLSRIFIGLIVVAIGVGYLGNALWNWDFKIFFDGWWTLFLIIPAIYSLIKWKINLFSILLLVTGVALLLNAQGLLTAGFWAVFLPVLVIVLGLYIIFGRLVNRKVKNFDSMVRNRQIGGDTSSCPEYTAIFGESRVKNVSPSLLGGEANAIFGSVTLDLREAKINQNITFDANAIFGGIDIFAPDDVRVELSGLPIFGGFSDKRLRGAASGNVLKINCFAAFGGITIK